VPTSGREPDTPRARLSPGTAAGERQRGLRGAAQQLAQRALARVRGEQDVVTLVRRGLRLGREVYIARGGHIDPGFPWLISIGDESTIGPNVTILSHDAATKLRTGYSLIAPVRIGARVFVGANATILPGAVIGDDAIVGAGSVVRRDVAAGTIVIGNPAEPIGSTSRHTERHLSALGDRPHLKPGVDEETLRRELLNGLEDGPGYVA